MTSQLANPRREMGTDPEILRRVRRLAAVSSVALGVVLLQSVTTLQAAPAVNLGLALGWLLMPTLLTLSIRRPWVRYLLIVPSALVSLSLVGLCRTVLPQDGAARAGWLLITGGVLMGGLLGLWFWYRLFPVPRFLDDAFSPGRWTLVATHVAAISIGSALVAVAAVS